MDGGGWQSCTVHKESAGTLTNIGGYRYESAQPDHTHSMLLGALLPALAGITRNNSRRPRLFDLGCGNGSAASAVSAAGYDVQGVDPSPTGIRVANQEFPSLRLEVGSAYDDLRSRFGIVDCVYSLEVIEHVYDPRAFVQSVRAMLGPEGWFILSTPYHGYLKNLALAVTGQMDKHFTALWDHGHIKFWSPRTITALLTEGGFRIHDIQRLGRVPSLARSMFVIAQRI